LTLVQLVQAEQERRWSAGDRPIVEDYLERYARLRDDAEAVVALLLHELRLRQQAGEQPQLEELAARFPALADPIAAVLHLEQVLLETSIGGPATGLSPSERPTAPPTRSFSPAATPAAAPPTCYTGPTGAGGEAVGPAVVPGYRVLGVLGKGGMGVVYKAEDTALHRLVALKMILYGDYAGPEERRRFQAEAEAVARLQHPNIIQVYEVGEHNGLPYFSLELCSGGSLEKQLDGTPWAPQRAAALVQVLAQAMQAAHQAGLVHRDIKPGNVLLTADGTPKVTDFGLVKRLDVPGHTQSGAVVGTPAYMAPEQAAGKSKEVGPPADIYALGAVLYELLTGRPPFRGPTAMETVLQVLQEVPVPVRRLQPKVPKDLETICLKCLEKGPQRRYLSAAALAEDLRRFGAGEPVTARPVTLAGRVWRWARRRPAQAGLVAVVLLALVAAGVGLSLFALHERKRLTQIEKANAILLSVFRALDPETEEKGGLPLRAQLAKRLDQATTMLEGEAVGGPLEVARLQMELGEAQRSLGYPERAIPLLTKARQTLESLLGPAHAETLTSMSYLASAYRDAGELDKAVRLYEEVLQKSQATLGPAHPDTLDTMNSLALMYQETGQLDKALPLFEQALKEMKAHLGEDDRKTLITMNNLALAYREAGQLGKALPLLEDARQKSVAKLGPDHADTLTILNSLASAYQDAGQLDKAVPLFEEVVAKFQAMFGPDHPDKLSAMNNLAMAYEDLGQRDKALSLFKQVLEKRQVKPGPDHPQTLGVMNNLAKCYLAAGQVQKALPLSEKALQKARDKLGPEHPHTLIFTNNLAEVYQALGHLDQAVPLFEQALGQMKATFGVDHPRTLSCMNRLATALQEVKQHDRALALWRELLRIQSAKLPAGYADLASAQAGLGRCLLQRGSYAEAEPVLREALAIRQKNQPDAWETFHSQSLLGGCLLGQKKYAEAERELLAGQAGMEKRQAKMSFPDRAYLKEGVERIVQLYEATGKKDQAGLWQQKRAGLKPGPGGP
jgi:tetratricopeptide (TPR) repeat protein